MDDIIVIGIAGGTGSGKTTITQKLREHFGDDVAVIYHDNYYKAHHDLSYEERSRLNYDHPNAFDTDRLVEDLKKLRAGQSIECPVYDYTIHDRSRETLVIHPARVIIVEGILIFHEPALRDLMDIKLFVDTDADVRILRRIRRDVKERGRSLDSVIDQYLTTSSRCMRPLWSPPRSLRMSLSRRADRTRSPWRWWSAGCRRISTGLKSEAV